VALPSNRRFETEGFGYFEHMFDGSLKLRHQPHGGVLIQATLGTYSYEFPFSARDLGKDGSAPGVDGEVTIGACRVTDRTRPSSIRPDGTPMGAVVFNCKSRVTEKMPAEWMP
jgi:hypothetical protein